MTSQTVRNLAAALCFLTITVTVAVLGYRINAAFVTLERKASVLLDTSTAGLEKAKTFFGKAGEAASHGETILQTLKEESQEREAVLHRQRVYQLASKSLAVLERINEETIPRFNDLIAHTDSNLNEKVLPETARLTRNLADTAERLSTTPETIENTLQVIAEETKMTMQAVEKLLSDPLWQKTLGNIERATAESAKTAENVTLTTAEIREAMKSAPEIARSVEKIASTSSKYQKIALIVQILVTIARVF